MNAIDMIARRLRLSFLNVQAAQEALPGIIDIMAEELKWSADEKKVSSNFVHVWIKQLVNIHRNYNRNKTQIELGHLSKSKKYKITVKGIYILQF